MISVGEINYIYNPQGQLERVEYPSGLSDTYRYTADHLWQGSTVTTSNKRW